MRDFRCAAASSSPPSASPPSPLLLPLPPLWVPFRLSGEPDIAAAASALPSVSANSISLATVPTYLLSASVRSFSPTGDAFNASKFSNRAMSVERTSPVPIREVRGLERKRRERRDGREEEEEEERASRSDHDAIEQETRWREIREGKSTSPASVLSSPASPELVDSSLAGAAVIEGIAFSLSMSSVNCGSRPRGRRTSSSQLESRQSERSRRRNFGKTSSHRTFAPSPSLSPTSSTSLLLLPSSYDKEPMSDRSEWARHSSSKLGAARAILQIVLADPILHPFKLRTRNLSNSPDSNWSDGAVSRIRFDDRLNSSRRGNRRSIPSAASHVHNRFPARSIDFK
mmetsp:Transcript_40997/g.123720  ORF Transcript_40997/g.123720 Transcript_40997/m.123720 type:complete len:343 (+) Transcript_40997:651-1679(+)